jgi:hypothetical protein
MQNDAARPLSSLLSSADDVLDAVRARKDDLALSNQALEHIAGYAEGTVNKYIGPSREKSPTLPMLYLLLQAMGLGLVLVEDAEAAKRMSHRWTKRSANVNRDGNGKVARLAIKRARPIVLTEVARKAATARWAGTTKWQRAAFVAMLNAARAAKRNAVKRA